jgi:hypothetical protein
MRFRQGGFIEHPEDQQDQDIPQPVKEYYWWVNNRLF